MKRNELINGKRYPMWGGLVDAKANMIGGTLTDHDSESTTELTDLTLEPTAPDSAIFTMHGKDFDCAVNVAYGGVSAGPEGGLCVHGYLMSFSLQPPLKHHEKEISRR